MSSYSSPITPARVADPYTPPDVIYLQAPDGEWETQRDADGVTWCADSVNETDLVYCRKGGSLGAKVLQQATLIAKQEAEIERLREECQAQYDRGYYDGRAGLEARGLEIREKGK